MTDEEKEKLKEVIDLLESFDDDEGGDRRIDEAINIVRQLVYEGGADGRT